MKAKNFKRGQSVLEYAILVVVVVGALLAMQWYMKGGYQGRLRSASDDLGEQYSPTQVASTVTTIGTGSHSREKTVGGANPVTTNDFDQRQRRVVDETLLALPTSTDPR